MRNEGEDQIREQEERHEALQRKQESQNRGFQEKMEELNERLRVMKVELRDDVYEGLGDIQ